MKAVDLTCPVCGFLVEQSKCQSCRRKIHTYKCPKCSANVVNPEYEGLQKPPAFK